MTVNPTRWPIRWQLAALLIFTQVAAHFVTVVMIDLSTAKIGGGRGELVITASEPLLTALRMSDPSDLPAMSDRIARMAAVDNRFRIEARLPEAANNPNQQLEAIVETALLNTLPVFWQDRVQVFERDGQGLSSMLPMLDFAVATSLPTGDWLVFEPRNDSFVQKFPRAVALLGLFILAMTLMFLSVWAGSALVAPIDDLARGAERFAGVAGVADAADLPERGPVEVRRATHAFNRMRQRIRKLINDRSQTLASIGHDMRTPLTRLELRLDLLEDSPAKEAIAGEVRVLERMINDALSFLRSENRPLVLEQVDLAVLAKTTADEFADQGHHVEYHGPQRVVVSCDHDQMRRVLENVIGNAAKFAGEASVHVLDHDPDTVVIEIRDHGPGIPSHLREKVLEPFARVETVRAGAPQKSEGFGLGLAIARDLMERHGGTLRLTENTPQGLVVTLTLPQSPSGEQSRNHIS